MTFNQKYGKLIYENPEFRGTLIMFRGFSIILTIFILFSIIYIRLFFLIYIFFVFLIMTIISLIIENQKIYTKGIMNSGFKIKNLFCPYNSIKSIEIISKNNDGNNYQLIRIFCFNRNDPLEFNNKFEIENKFFKKLKEILQKKFPNLINGKHNP